eukprot:GHUV01031979.1.p1 GENE.GHUV01031979.1~~GHUV01031979.1.p1  ORF type:complete len:174 (+),score=25.34 GHUV01031979.1:571-1092(+)
MTPCIPQSCLMVGHMLIFGTWASALHLECSYWAMHQNIASKHWTSVWVPHNMQGLRHRHNIHEGCQFDLIVIVCLPISWVYFSAAFAPLNDLAAGSNIHVGKRRQHGSLTAALQEVHQCCLLKMTLTDWFHKLTVLSGLCQLLAGVLYCMSALLSASVSIVKRVMQLGAYLRL